MSVPHFVQQLREHVGHAPLWLSGASAVVVDPAGWLLLEQRCDTGMWVLPGGIIDPGEQPADAVVRECFEETGVVVHPEWLSSVSVSPPITYHTGDQARILELAFRCRPVSGRARVNDDESVAVRWWPLESLPDIGEGGRAMVLRALEPERSVSYSFSGIDAILGPGRSAPSGPVPAAADVVP